MTDLEEVSWVLGQRFEFIEWRCYWAGRVNRKDLEDEFQISTPQASAAVGAYQAACPGNIEYNATEKTFLATPDFRPKFLQLSSKRYLLQLNAITSEAIRKSDTWFDQTPFHDITPPIVRFPEPYVLRAIIRAIENGSALPINYRSLTSAGMRTICPHALGHDGYRWHVRALSVEKQEYRDYVLGRILSINQPQECDSNPSDDAEWQERIDLRLVAHPGLDKQQRAAIEHDYQLKDGLLVVPIRLALAFYFIKRHNLDLRDGQIPPSRAQLFLENYDELLAASKRAKELSQQLLAERAKRPV